MDDRQRDELKAWLEFYRELGLEDFYRREPGVPAPVLAEEGSKEWSGASAQARATDKGPRITDKLQTPPPGAVVPAKPTTPGPDLGLRTSDLGPFIQPPTPTLSLFEEAPAQRSGPETLEQILQDLGACCRCKLAPTRKTIVFGEGNPHAGVVFIGEGPGADEDEQGLPFVGRAGQLLNRMLQAIGLKRADVYICNIIKCRPPGNRTPEKDEVDACSPFLFRQIEAIKPRLICCLGAPAVRTVLGIKEGITKIRGQFYNFGSAKALATVHPAYILRNPREEGILREDFEKIRDFLSKR
jgi:DNA polymerase